MTKKLRKAPEGWRWKNGIGFLPLGRKPVAYNEAYFNRYVGLAQTEQGHIITNLRVQLVERWVKNLHSNLVLDIGIGCGAFLKAMQGRGWKVAGIDVNPFGQRWLEENGLNLTPLLGRPNVLTLWDVLEHIPNARGMLARYRAQYVFLCMPIYESEQDALRSKHFKPGEHCWYFTMNGLLYFMAQCGYTVKDVGVEEVTLGGRESIMSFAFCR